MEAKQTLRHMAGPTGFGLKGLGLAPGPALLYELQQIDIHIRWWRCQLKKILRNRPMQLRRGTFDLCKRLTNVLQRMSILIYLPC